MQNESRLKKNGTKPVVRISIGHFAPEKYDEVNWLIAESAILLRPAIQALEGLLCYHVGLDASTNIVVNLSIWETEQGARQMDTLAPMLAQRPILAAGMQFDKIANDTPAWKLEGNWSFGEEVLDEVVKPRKI
jgi:hypothetical protein